MAKPKLNNTELILLFKNAKKSLIEIIQNSNATSPFRSYRVEQTCAIDLVIKRLTIDLRDWTNKEVPKAIHQGAADAQQVMEEFDETEFPMQFAGVPESAVKVLTEDAYLDFGKAIVGMRQDGLRALINKRKLQEKIVESVIQGSSVARTQAQLIDILKKEGFTALRSNNGLGRSFSVENYTNMLVRTQMMTAYNIGARTQMLDVGRLFGVFPTIRPDIDGEDICNEWERKKYVNLQKDPLPPASTHPNCRHVIQPVSFEELKNERPDLYEQAIKYFNKTAAA